MFEPWRYRCPRGHARIRYHPTAVQGNTDLPKRLARHESAQSRYYCITCSQKGHDPHFNELLDAKTDRVPVPGVNDVQG